jgi:enoyl-CoA hydratase/carnithine racemase
MKGPAALLRSDKIEGYKNLGPIFGWVQNESYLIIDLMEFRSKVGAVLCYYNPPVHQVGNPGLDAYLQGLEMVLEKKNDLCFLLLHGPSDPVHAGGDLKESLTRLDSTLERKKAKQAEGASYVELDSLFDWADNRLRKGVGLHSILRKIASCMRVVATCGGGTRFGGSAEIPLMADWLVGDSRSGMCFSEAMIGLIPGWAGVARTIIKAGLKNAEIMAKTSREIKAAMLNEIGIYNRVVEVSFPFPRRQKSGDPEADRVAFDKSCLDHEENTGMIILPEAFFMCTCEAEELPPAGNESRKLIAKEEDVRAEVMRRKDTATFTGLYGRPLAEVREEMAKLGRPLAPQSIETLDRLLSTYDISNFDESEFVEREMLEDAALYRHPRFRAGLVATLEQRVADFREA